MRIGTKSLLGSCSSRLVSGLFTPWALVLHHPLSRLWSRTYSSPSTSPSPSAPNSFGESSCFFYILWYVSDYLLCRSLEEITWNTSLFYFLWFSSWCEDRLTLGRDLALVELGRRHNDFFGFRVLRVLGLLLADGAPTVGRGKTFWLVN